jgi:hypothetical protein
MLSRPSTSCPAALDLLGRESMPHPHREHFPGERKKMPPCRHDPPVPERCRLCWLVANDSRYRALWSAGEATTPMPTVRRPLPCLYLGPVMMRAPCLCRRQDVRRCEKGHGAVRQADQCETCSDYEPDG